MKKILTMVLCSVFLITVLTGCGTKPKVEDDDFVNANGARLWFAGLYGEQWKAGEIKECNLSEFPGVTFRCNEETLTAVTDEESVLLYDGMPIWSVYFYDLTSDGYPELCSTISVGSGISDNRVIVYDYAEGASYQLADRGKYDYTLNMQGNDLIVEKRPFNTQDQPLESGKLIFSENTIRMQTEN